MRFGRSILASLWLASGAAGCSEEPPRFVATRDAGPEVMLSADVPPLDAGQAFDAGPAVDRPAVRTFRDFVLPGTVADAPMRFGGAESAEGEVPTLLYPEDRTIIPPNLPLFEVHFRPGAGNDLFEVSFAGDVTTVRYFTRCSRVADGCIVTLTGAQLADVAMASAGGSGVRIAVRGTASGQQGGAVRRSAARFLGITQSSLRGGVYWWATNGNILRYEFGREEARAEVFLRGDPAFNCVGCHSLSRDGRRITAGRGIPGPAVANITEVATRTNNGGAFGSNFGTYSPDNTRYLSSDGMRLTLLNADTAMPATGLAPNTAGTHPDWSPNGDRVVFARPQQTVPIAIGTPGHSGPTDLMMLPWDGSAFGQAQMFLPSTGDNQYYPSFSPNGQWVVFNRSGQNSNDAPDAALWVMRADGTGQPVRLAAADAQGGNSWPKWTPFIERYVGELDEPLMWVTFTSRRDYGLRLQQSTRPRENQRAQLWMAAFRPGVQGVDPSAPAFWVPFQNLNDGNHIAQWVEEVRRQECGDAGVCAAGETCIRGRCIGAPP